VHHIHQTEGFIIDSKNTGQADRVLFVFTEKLGLVAAAAKSVREMRSKLRPHLQEGMQSRFSLVHGKSGWRVTGAEQVVSWFEILSGDSLKQSIFARVSFLLRRFLHGEEPHQELYNLLSHGFTFLRDLESEKKKLDAFEALIVLRVLNLLGYVGKNSVAESLWSIPYIWNRPLLGTVEAHYEEVLVHINRALRESHL